MVDFKKKVTLCSVLVLTHSYTDYHNDG